MTTAWNWRVVIFAVGFLAIAGNLSELAFSSRAPKFSDPTVPVRGQSLQGVPDENGKVFWRVTRVDPGSPFETAGIVPGDLLRYAFPVDVWRYRKPGDTYEVTVNHGGELRVQTITELANVESRTRAVNFYGSVLTGSILTLIGIFITWRRPTDAPLIALSVFLVDFGIPLPMVSPRPLADVMATVVASTSWMWAPGLLYFCANYHSEASSVRRDRVRKAIVPVTVLIALVVIFDDFSALLGYTITAQKQMRHVAVILVFILAGIALFDAWRRAPEALGHRIAYLFTVFGAYLLLQGISILLKDIVADIWPFIELLQNLANIALAGALAYAVLSRHLLNLGFVVNRALVYGITSLMLAATFILLAQIANRGINLPLRENSRFIDLAIGLGLALCGRQVARWVDPRVQRVFFRRWHESARKLASFRIEAIHGMSVEAIEKGLVEAILEYSTCRGCALYLCASDGRWIMKAESAANPFPMSLDAAHPLAQELSASKGSVRNAAHDGIGSALALPMRAHGRLIGAMLVAPREDDYLYRPDELHAMAQAVQQVGLELELARLKRLEVEVADGAGKTAPAVPAVSAAGSNDAPAVEASQEVDALRYR